MTLTYQAMRGVVNCYGANSSELNHSGNVRLSVVERHFSFGRSEGFTNALVPLNRDGLRSNLILTGAVEFGF